MSKRKEDLSEREQSRWVERVARFCVEYYGLPPITGRILGYLLICDPAEQSAADIAHAIEASRSSLTTNMPMLTTTFLVRKVNRRGERTTYYCIDDNAWEKVIEHRIRSLFSFQDITREGLVLLGEKNPRALRIKRAHESMERMSRFLKKNPTSDIDRGD